MEQTNLITFEMPANDLMRVGLCFEYLKLFADKYVARKTEQDSIVCMSSIIEMLQLLDRPELRSKYYQEFSRFSMYLEKLYQTENIDQVKLHSIIEKLNIQTDKLNKRNGKFANELRENFFIKNLLQFSDKPGAFCGYYTPEYYLWMHKSNEIRYDDLKNWLSCFDEIAETNQLLLQLVRGCSKYSVHTANEGFYQQSLDTKTPCHLIQVKINKELDCFPRISIVRHGISIIFLKSEAEKDHRSINFELNLCAL